jgi:hypothetical protein
MTIQNLGTRLTLLSLSANDVVTATANRSGVDLVDYEGDVIAVLDAEAGGAGITYAVKIQDSADNSSFADVSGGLAFTANTALRETLRINTDEVRRYIRAVITVAGGTGAGAVSVVALGSKKYG